MDAGGRGERGEKDGDKKGIGDSGIGDERIKGKEA